MAHTEPPQDPRHYVRVTVDLPLNRKINRVPRGARWTYVVSLCYGGGALSDGIAPVRALLAMADGTRRDAQALIAAGLWHEPGHDCPRCPQPGTGEVVVHDYLAHQRSGAEARALSDARRAAGRAGGLRSGQVRRTKTAGQYLDGPEADPEAPASPLGAAEETREDQIRAEKKIPPPSPSAPRPAPWQAELAERVAGLRPEWSTEEVLAVLTHRKLRRLDQPLVARAFELVAKDPATVRPGRLLAPHPYWTQARAELAAAARSRRGLPAAHPLRLDAHGTPLCCPLPARHPVHLKGGL